MIGFACKPLPISVGLVDFAKDYHGNAGFKDVHAWWFSHAHPRAALDSCDRTDCKLASYLAHFKTTRSGFSYPPDWKSSDRRQYFRRCLNWKQADADKKVADWCTKLLSAYQKHQAQERREETKRKNADKRWRKIYAKFLTRQKDALILVPTTKRKRKRASPANPLRFFRTRNRASRPAPGLHPPPTTPTPPGTHQEVISWRYGYGVLKPPNLH